MSNYCTPFYTISEEDKHVTINSTIEEQDSIRHISTPMTRPSPSAMTGRQGQWSKKIMSSFGIRLHKFAALLALQSNKITETMIIDLGAMSHFGMDTIPLEHLNKQVYLMDGSSIGRSEKVILPFKNHPAEA